LPRGARETAAATATRRATATRPQAMRARGRAIRALYCHCTRRPRAARLRFHYQFVSHEEQVRPLPRHERHLDCRWHCKAYYPIDLSSREKPQIDRAGKVSGRLCPRVHRRRLRRRVCGCTGRAADMGVGGRGHVCFWFAVLTCIYVCVERRQGRRGECGTWWRCGEVWGMRREWRNCGGKQARLGKQKIKMAHRVVGMSGSLTFLHGKRCSFYPYSGRVSV
jgi:hypothetical protein